MFTLKFYFTPTYKVRLTETKSPTFEEVMTFTNTNVTPEVTGIRASGKTPEDALNKIFNSFLNRIETLQKEENTLKERMAYLNSIDFSKIDLENE